MSAKYGLSEAVGHCGWLIDHPCEFPGCALYGTVTPSMHYLANIAARGQGSSRSKKHGSLNSRPGKKARVVSLNASGIARQKTLDLQAQRERQQSKPTIPQVKPELVLMYTKT